jgi:hypothetical protein
MIKAAIALVLGLVAAEEPPIEATAPTPKGEDIVVTGAASGEGLRGRVSAFVTTLSPVLVDGQYSRWNDPVCPAVRGIDPQLGAVVAAKIRVEAERADIEVAPAGCRPNIVVLFGNDGRRQMAEIARRQPATLDGTLPAERRRLLDSTAPVRWWYNLRTEGSSGEQPMPGGAGLLSQNFPIGFPQSRKGILDTYSSSFIDTKQRISIDNVVVLVDPAAMSGQTLNQLAAYVAMVSLARIGTPAGHDRLPSILGLFAADRARPRDLTAWDRAYLASLAATPANRTGRVQKLRLVSNMLETLGDE